MPIKTQNDLPVKEILERENIFVMDENRASHQNIRQLEIAIVNLMPLKEDNKALSLIIQHMLLQNTIYTSRMA